MVPARHLDDRFFLESSHSIFWKASKLISAMHLNRELLNLRPRDQPRSVFEISKRCSFLKYVVYFVCSVVAPDAPHPISHARTNWHLATIRRNWSIRDSKYRPEVSSVSVRLLSSASRYISRLTSYQWRARQSAPGSSEACYVACPDPDNFFLSISFWRTRCAWRMARYGPSCGRRASSSSQRTVVSWVRPFFSTQTIVVFIVHLLSLCRILDASSWLFLQILWSHVYIGNFSFPIYFIHLCYFILSRITPGRKEIYQELAFSVYILRLSIYLGFRFELSRTGNRISFRSNRRTIPREWRIRFRSSSKPCVHFESLSRYEYPEREKKREKEKARKREIDCEAALVLLVSLSSSFVS